MNPLVVNLLTELKSKQLKDWTVSELEDYAFCIQYMYMYLNKEDVEERKILNSVYNKIWGWVNSNRAAGTVINPGFLIMIDKKKGW